MESIRQPQQKNLIARIWPFVVLAFGLYRLADWVYGGREALPSLLAGIGFLLMVPGAFFQTRRQGPHTGSATRRVYLSLTVAGLALVIAAIGYRWL